MQTKRKTFILGALLTALLLMITMTSITAAENVKLEAVTNNVDVDWTTYTDPRFEFTISYPTNWFVIPRNDNLGVGNTLTFSQVDPERMEGYDDLHNAPPKVEIGMYLVSWSEHKSLPGRSLKEWIDEYNKLSQGADISVNRVNQSHRVLVDQREALYEEGRGLSNFRYTAIPRGDIVWFIWSNVEEESHIILYEQMVSSFKFGKNTPNTLQEIYGEDFRSFPLRREDTSVSNQYNNGLKGFTDIYALSSSWRVPLNGGPWQAT